MQKDCRIGIGNAITAMLIQCTVAHQDAPVHMQGIIARLIVRVRFKWLSARTDVSTVSVMMKGGKGFTGKHFSPTFFVL
jgi:hypothetical protein